MSVPKCLFFKHLEAGFLAGCPQGYPVENYLFELIFRF